MNDRSDQIEASAYSTEATGIPAQGFMDQGDSEPLGDRSIHQWKQAEIIATTLDDQGDLFFAFVEMTQQPSGRRAQFANTSHWGGMAVPARSSSSPWARWS